MALAAQIGKVFRESKTYLEVQSMTVDKVSFFKPYPFEIGQKIRIDGSRRNGDWEVVGLTDHKVTLRCPVSGKEFEWTRFCYHVEDKTDVTWPE